MRYHVTIARRTFVVDVEAGAVRVDDEPIAAELMPPGSAGVSGLRLKGATHRLWARQVARDDWEVHIDGHRVRADVVDERTWTVREMVGGGGRDDGPQPVRAPMPGLVIKVEVEVGDVVQEGQGIVIVEAMKMENELTVPSAGRVARVLVEAGQTVEKDEVLVDLEALAEEAG